MSGKEKPGAWDPEWETIHKNKSWGKYPSEHLIRCIAHNFYQRPDRSQVRILELGCATGAQLWFLAREGFTAYGVEGSETAVQAARARMEEEHLDADIEVGDVVQLNFPDGYFDCVVDVECITCNDWDSAKRIVQESRRVLKPAGILFSQTLTDQTYIGQNPREIAKNTYRGSTAGDIARERLVRVLAEEDLPSLYGGFSQVLYDKVTFTYGPEKRVTEEWIITCMKS